MNMSLLLGQNPADQKTQPCEIISYKNYFQVVVYMGSMSTLKYRPCLFKGSLNGMAYEINGLFPIWQRPVTNFIFSELR